MNLLDYFNSVDIFTEENFNEMISYFGFIETVNFFIIYENKILNDTTINSETKKYLLKKMEYFFVNKEDMLNKTNTDSYEEEISLNYEDNILDISHLFFNDIKKYTLLTEEEEKKYGYDLLLVNDLKIISNKKVNKNTIKIIDLEKIFVSLNNENVEYILNEILEYCSKNYNNNNQIIIDYINEYQKLCNKLSRTPNPEELNNYFSKYEKYQLFNNFNETEKIGSKELLIQIKNYIKYQIAFNKMVDSNIALVISIAKKYKYNDNFLDLIDEGACGLIRAVNNFDVNLGFKFSSYATNCIKQAIFNYLSNKNPIIRPSKTILDLNKKINDLEQKYGRYLTNEELSSELNIKYNEIVEIQNYNNHPLSLDQTISEDGMDSLIDFIPDNNSDLENEIYKKLLKEDIKTLFEYLTDKEAAVIKLRFGIDTENNTTYTLNEIAKLFNLSTVRIKSIENTALRKMRIKAHNFIDYLR